MTSTLREFVTLSYDKLEEMNLAAKEQRLNRVSYDKVREERMRYLADEKGIKAVTVCFSDLEGRLHMLDYDKKFLLGSEDNLTFDGSSIRGFSRQSESDLRLKIDWPAFYWLPSDIFGPGKVLVFGEVQERDGTPYHADMRSQLKHYAEKLYSERKIICNIANEIEGFLFKGRDAEQKYADTRVLDFVSTGGYYHTLPGDPLRQFIDTAAEVQRAMGFANEKDHPEVAPAQFEMNYSYTEATIAADQIQLYKLICRQVAYINDMTASFLPKPVTGINGSGMHTNLSLSENGNNLFYDNGGKESMSAAAWEFIGRVLGQALDICLILNPSVNSYRRLDPHFEAPNEIKASPIDRGSMVRIPIGNSRSARIEVRTVSPDANPYMVLYTILKTGLEGPKPGPAAENLLLPGNIYDALADFEASDFARDLLGADIHERYAELKRAVADRCPRLLGTRIKGAEIQYHHEVTNQLLWGRF